MAEGQKITFSVIPWMLVKPGMSPIFAAEHVALMPSASGSKDKCVPMFTTTAAVDECILEFAVRGKIVEAFNLKTHDELTDLLSRLKDRGAVDVAFDPKPDRVITHPIDSIIIRFQVAG